ncbi:hypothetical protein WJR50_13750 [Catalinimonas sp. 4WD22]|uniref:DUF6970 domain-containing protein n=1 Tax=Catalinimonas locisalis TaxID=3133978 RepID=UPI0031014B07
MSIAFIFIGITACEEPDLQVDVPTCIEKKIRKIKREEVQNPPAKVWRWEADRHTYFYITSGCCDQFNYLYDDDCDIVCAPDGGFTGGGDGNCSDLSEPIEYTLVWEDNREYK